MASDVTYKKLRSALAELGFTETRRSEGLALKHLPSKTVFLFRHHEDSDPLPAAELFVVRKGLDERGLLEPERFDVLLAKASA